MRKDGVLPLFWSACFGAGCAKVVLAGYAPPCVETCAWARDIPRSTKSSSKGRKAQMPFERDVQAQEGILAVVLSLIVALFGSLLTYVSVCAEQHACTSAGTCYATRNSSSWSCTFKTSITPAGWQMLNVTEQSTSLQSMTRGCVRSGAPAIHQPGERRPSVYTQTVLS